MEGVGRSHFSDTVDSVDCGGAGLLPCHAGNQVPIAYIDLCEDLQPGPWAPAGSLHGSLVQ